MVVKFADLCKGNSYMGKYISILNQPLVTIETYTTCSISDKQDAYYKEYNYYAW